MGAIRSRLTHCALPQSPPARCRASSAGACAMEREISPLHRTQVAQGPGLDRDDTRSLVAGTADETDLVLAGGELVLEQRRLIDERTIDVDARGRLGIDAE